MRFQAVERVSSGDPERVLIVLEQHLRSVAGGVEREGSRIILSGLGPSPRAINRMDTTVIDVMPENGATRIDAEVSFQASALLGTVGQEEIVREKLEKIFGATKEQLEEERIEAARAQERAERERAEAEKEAARAEAARAEAERVEAARVVATRVDAANAEVRRLANIAARRAAAEAADAEAEKKQLREAVDALNARKAAGSRAKQAAETMPIRHAEREAVAGDSDAFEAASDRDDQRGEERGKRYAPDRSWLKWAGLGACLLIVSLVAGYFSTQQGSRAVRQAPLSAETDGEAKKSLPDAGPEGAVRQWELAMRSTDVGTQVAYYAVPVEQYMWKHNVSRHDLEAIKQGEIARRRGLWTVKIEDVNIKRTGDTATVSLVKHTMEQPQGSKVRERFIPSQLTLKNSLGIWWITSERDLVQRRALPEAAAAEEEGETPDWARPAAQSNAAQQSATPSAASPN